MTSLRVSGIIRTIGLSAATLLLVSTASIAQVSGANIFNRVAGGEQLADMGKTNVAELVDAIASKLWIVGGTEVPHYPWYLQTGILAAPSSDKSSSAREWMIEQSETFKLASKVDPDSDDKMLRSYAGYYGIVVGDALPAKRLSNMLDEVAYGDERPVVFWPGSKGPVDLTLPCCKPLDAKMLTKALENAGLVGEKGVFTEKGASMAGHLLIVLAPLPVESDKPMAPGLGDSRKSVGGVVLVLEGGS